MGKKKITSLKPTNCLKLVIFLCLLSFSATGEPIKNYVVYYSDKAGFKELESYDLLVFDSQVHPPLRSLMDRGKILLGYISLGEVEKHRSYYEAVKKQGILGQENIYWKGSYYVDLRDPKWAKRVLEDLIPAILQQGFDGLFLDTLDNPGDMERKDPAKFKGMVNAAAHLVKGIRKNYPSIKIMMNRGYELLPQVAEVIDFEMGESLYSDYNFKTKKYGFVAKSDYVLQMKWLKDAKKKNPNLQIVSLDYWDPKDKAEISQIYEVERKNGFIPYVATVDLDVIVPEPPAPKR